MGLIDFTGIGPHLLVQVIKSDASMLVYQCSCLWSRLYVIMLQAIKLMHIRSMHIPNTIVVVATLHDDDASASIWLVLS
jgi:hypothetical protein